MSDDMRFAEVNEAIAATDRHLQAIAAQIDRLAERVRALRDGRDDK